MLLKKKFMLTLAATSAVIASVAYYMLMPEGVPGQLYQYYPTSTGFYLELAPGEKLTHRFVSYLQEKNAEQELLEAQEEALQLPELTAPKQEPAKSASLEPKPKTDSKPDTEQKLKTAPVPQTEAPPKPKQHNFRRAFLQKFENTFEPYLSVGAWPNPGQNPDEGHMLVVLPLKEDLTLPELVRRFNLPASDFESDRYRQTLFYIEKESQIGLAIVNRKLLISNTPEAIHQALAHGTRKQPNVYEQPENKRYLARLPRMRQGTFILNNTVYTPNALTGGGNSIASRIGSGMSGFSHALPLTVGAIRAQREDVVNVEFLTPIQLKNLPSESFRKSLREVYRSSERFGQAEQLPADTTLMVGMTGMDRAYDFYRDYLMQPDAGRMLKIADFYLSNFRMDFRRDVVSLLEHRTVIAARPGNTSLILLLDKDTRKDQALDRLSTLFTAGAFPIKQQTEQVGDLSIRTLSLPQASPEQKLNYGTLSGRGGSSIAFATPKDYQALMAVRTGTHNNLAETPEYRQLMESLPGKSTVQVYLNLKNPSRKPQPAMQPDWIEGLGLSLRVTPEKADETDLLEGQLNLKLKTAQH
ncbi:MAG TPA: DUF3352 domain-containing protein [Coleofasciculaceae cyanobacterium]|jgi:hypothetical protein